MYRRSGVSRENPRDQGEFFLHWSCMPMVVGELGGSWLENPVHPTVQVFFRLMK